jgi:hypothetical protein
LPVCNIQAHIAGKAAKTKTKKEDVKRAENRRRSSSIVFIYPEFELETSNIINSFIIHSFNAKVMKK